MRWLVSGCWLIAIASRRLGGISGPDLVTVQVGYWLTEATKWTTEEA